MKLQGKSLTDTIRAASTIQTIAVSELFTFAVSRAYPVITTDFLLFSMFKSLLDVKDSGDFWNCSIKTS